MRKVFLIGATTITIHGLLALLIAHASPSDLASTTHSLFPSWSVPLISAGEVDASEEAETLETGRAMMVSQQEIEELPASESPPERSSQTPLDNFVHQGLLALSRLKEEAPQKLSPKTPTQAPLSKERRRQKKKRPPKKTSRQKKEGAEQPKTKEKQAPKDSPRSPKRPPRSKEENPSQPKEQLLVSEIPTKSQVQSQAQSTDKNGEAGDSKTGSERGKREVSKGEESAQVSALPRKGEGSGEGIAEGSQASASALSKGLEGKREGVLEGPAPKTDSKALLVSYLKRVQRQLKSTQRYPRVARKMLMEGTVLVAVTISLKGEIRHVELSKSSGYPLLDEAALSAIRALDSLPAPPKALGWRKEKILKIPYRFKLRRA